MGLPSFVMFLHLNLNEIQLNTTKLQYFEGKFHYFQVYHLTLLGPCSLTLFVQQRGYQFEKKGTDFVSLLNSYFVLPLQKAELQLKAEKQVQQVDSEPWFERFMKMANAMYSNDAGHTGIY